MVIKRKFAVVFVLMLLSLLGYSAAKQVPIPIGDTEDYWEFACGIELKKFDGYFKYARWTGIFPEKDGWYYYFYQEHHGRHVFKVSKQALLDTAEEVYALLEAEIKDTVQTGFRGDEEKANQLKVKNKRRNECLQIKHSTHLSQDQFINTVNQESSRRYREGFFARIEDAKEHRKIELKSFQAQLDRSKLYWASILFEAIFLPLWWLYSFHGGVFGKFNDKLSLRLALSPLFLFIPHYLGYAPYLFSFGPSGGILYPFFAVLIGLPFGLIPFNPIEMEILKVIPQPLYYISQIPAAPLAISFKGSVSPSVLIGYALIVILIAKIVDIYRTK